LQAFTGKMYILCHCDHVPKVGPERAVAISTLLLQNGWDCRVHLRCPRSDRKTIFTIRERLHFFKVWEDGFEKYLVKNG